MDIQLRTLFLVIVTSHTSSKRTMHFKCPPRTFQHSLSLSFWCLLITRMVLWWLLPSVFVLASFMVSWVLKQGQWNGMESRAPLDVQLSLHSHLIQQAYLCLAFAWVPCVWLQAGKETSSCKWSGRIQGQSQRWAHQGLQAIFGHRLTLWWQQSWS